MGRETAQPLISIFLVSPSASAGLGTDLQHALVEGRLDLRGSTLNSSGIARENEPWERSLLCQFSPLVSDFFSPRIVIVCPVTLISTSFDSHPGNSAITSFASPVSATSMDGLKASSPVNKIGNPPALPG